MEEQNLEQNSKHEETLNLLFGEDTNAKNDLEKLAEEVILEKTRDILKQPLADNKENLIEVEKPKEEEKTFVEDLGEKTEENLNIASNKPTDALVDDSISSYNSSRIIEDQPISKINSDSLHPNEEITEISSHNNETQSFN